MEKAFLVGWMIFWGCANPLFAQNVSVSPPPLGYPDYNFAEPVLAPDQTADLAEQQPSQTADPQDLKQKTSGRAEGFYTNLAGESFEMTILGFSSTTDQFDETLFGSRLNLSFYFGSGSAQGTEMSLIGYDFGFLATQGFQADNLTPIVFVGPSLGFSFFSSEFADATSLYLGLTAGLQILIDAGDLVFSPAYSMTSRSGTTEVSTVDTSSSVDYEYTATTLSIDVLLKSNGITLSGILQAAQEDDEATDSTTIRFGTTF